MQETWVQYLVWEDPLEKEMATHSSILDCKIPWGLVGYSPWGHKESNTTLKLNNNTQQQQKVTKLWTTNGSVIIWVNAVRICMGTKVIQGWLWKAIISLNWQLLALHAYSVVFLYTLDFLKIFIYIFIWLHRVLVVACGIFSTSCRIFATSCRICPCDAWTL